MEEKNRVGGLSMHDRTCVDHQKSVVRWKVVELFLEQSDQKANV